MPLKSKEPELNGPKKESVNIPEAKTNTLLIDEELISLIATSVNDVADESGWAFLGEVGNLISKKQPDFDSRNYGFARLTNLVRSLNRFEIEQRKTINSRIKHVYIKNK